MASWSNRMRYRICNEGDLSQPPAQPGHEPTGSLLPDSRGMDKTRETADGQRRRVVCLLTLGSLLVFGGGLMVGLVAGMHHGSQRKRMTAYNVVDEAAVTEYRDLMKLTADVLEGNGIRYWAAGGTAMGAFRNSPPGLIRWDDDLDLGVFQKDMDKILELFKACPEIELDEIDDWKGLTMRLKRSRGMSGMPKMYHMDIFGYDFYEDGPNGPAYYVVKRDGSLRFPESKYHLHEIEAPVDCAFWDLTIKCPGDLEKILVREYGKNMMTEGYVNRHEEGFFRSNGFKSTRIDMAHGINDHNGYLPAMNLDLLKKLKFVDEEL